MSEKLNSATYEQPSYDESPNERSLESIEALNLKSWYMNPDESRPFIAMSVTDVGPSRDQDLPRTALAGNMSLVIGDPNLTPEQRNQAGKENVNNFIQSFNVLPETVKVLKAQEKYDGLVMVDADAQSIEPDSGQPLSLEKADFVYTRNPEVVLGVKPADCPIIVTSAMTDKGPILCYTHIPWRGAEAGHVENMFGHYQQLGIEPESIRIFISPGARKESYPYTFSKEQFAAFTHKDLFADVQENGDGSISCNIDVSPVIRKTLHNFGVDDYQIFEDTSDTASQESGYSSHSRASRSNGKEINTRSLLISSLKPREFVPKAS